MHGKKNLFRHSFFWHFQYEFVLFNRKKYLRLFQSRKAVSFSPWNTGHPLAPWRDSWRLDASETRPEFPGGFLETMSVNDTASICSCLNLRDRCTYRSTVILMEEWPNISLSAGILTVDSTQRVAKVCPYGIITTNRKSPVHQGFSVIWQGFSSFSKPKNRAAK